MSDTEKDVIIEEIIEIEPEQKPKKKKGKIDKVLKSSITNMDLVIKAISFLMAIGVLVLFGAVAAVLVMLDKAFALIAIGVGILGIVCALIVLFIIYGIGHIITQNNEILKRK